MSLYYVAFKMTKWVEQKICIKFCVKLEHSSMETIWMIQKAAAMATDDWQLHHNKASAHALCLMQSFLAKLQISQVTQPPYSPGLAPCNFWLFLKLKSPSKEKTIDEIQENMMGQLMAIGRPVWGPKMPTLEGTEASLSHIQCFLYLVSSSTNVSVFHITWLDTFWTDLTYCTGWNSFTVRKPARRHLHQVIRANVNINETELYHIPAVWCTEKGLKSFCRILTQSV